MKPYKSSTPFRFCRPPILWAALLIGCSNHLMAAIKVACVGDSITYGVGTTTNESYPSQLQQLLGSGYTVKNYGEPGATMIKDGDIPYWYSQQFTDSGNFLPDIVIIMLGTNDAKSENWVHSANYVPDYESMIDHYRNLSSHPAVYINTCPTVFNNGNYGVSNYIVTGQIVPLIKQISMAKICPLIDINAATANIGYDFPDNIHPNDAGALVLAQTVFNSLTVIANGTYKIVNRNSGLVADCKHDESTNGTPVQQYTYSGGANQQWTVTGLGNGYYKIIGVASGLALDVIGSGTANGTLIDIWPFNSSSANQEWTFTATSGGYYRLTPANATSSCLDVQHSGTTNSIPLEIWTYGGGNSQQWRLQAP